MYESPPHRERGGSWCHGSKVNMLLVCFVLGILTGWTVGQVQDPIRTYCSNFCEACYSQRDICEKCGEGFYFHEFYKVCLLGEIPGCQIYASRTLCSVCHQGYRNVRGTCQSCTLARCGTCENDVGTCQQCRVGYTFSTGVIATSTCDLLCRVENCRFCFAGNAQTCSVCADGYRLDASSKCQRCTMNGCLRCSTTVSVCDAVCINGFYWQNGSCQQCMTGCKTCSTAGACLACDTNAFFYMDRNRRCVRFGALVTIATSIFLSVWALL